jgi:hypothetical protein
VLLITIQRVNATSDVSTISTVLELCYMSRFGHLVRTVHQLCLSTYTHTMLIYLSCTFDTMYRPDGRVEVLTKGDNNRIDDRQLYAPGQQWLQVCYTIVINTQHLLSTVACVG